jgi:hypothetical protein
MSRDAENFVAGKAFGTTFKRVRRREFVTVNEVIETAQKIFLA